MPFLTAGYSWRCAAGLLLLVLLPSGGNAQTAPSLLSALEKETVRLVERVDPSVVNLIIQRKQVMVRDGVTVTDWERETGSGVVIHEDGYILTTADLARNMHEALVSFPDGQHRPGTLVGVDPISGIVVIRVDSVSVTPARIGDSDTILPGSWTLILTHAFGIPSTMSLGIVNGYRQEDVLLQVTALANPGFIGAPVFSMEGKLIGMATTSSVSTYPDEGGGASFMFNSGGSGTLTVIPINRIKTFARHLIEYGEIRRSWLGVFVEKLWDSVPVGANINIVLGSVDGMYINRVFKDSPAEKAGLRVGDRLLSVNGIPMNHPVMLAEFVTTLPAGSDVEIRYVRDNQEMVAHTRLTSMPSFIEEVVPFASEISPEEEDVLENPELFQAWIREHEMEMAKHQMEIERLKRIWQDRIRQSGMPESTKGAAP